MVGAPRKPRDAVEQPLKQAVPPPTPGLGEATRLFAAALWREVIRLLAGVARASRHGVAWLACMTKDTSRAARAGVLGLASAYRRRTVVGSSKETIDQSGTANPNYGHADRSFEVLRSSWANHPIGSAVIGFAALVCLGLSVTLIAAFMTLPDLEEVETGVESQLVFADSEGNPLIARGSVPSTYAGPEQIPDVLKDAVVAIEDRRFFDHGGLDFRAILRAGVINLRAGRIVQGGSTLTQQLVKISYLKPERTFSRKLHEAVLTKQLEWRLSKQEILTRYLNSVYLGTGSTGMPAAAQVYFGTDISKLSLAQSAALAAMIRAPSAVNPFSNLDLLKDRAALVIDLMLEQSRIDKGSANAARAELASMAPERATASYGSWFSDWVVNEADKLSGRFDGVVTLHTTFDPEIQTIAEASVQAILEEAGSTAEAALIAMTPSGQIVAMVGGRDYSQSQFNRATDALRSPGSTFKTFVYLTALAQGILPGDRINDAPINIDGYRPENFGGRFRGKVTLAEAFARSLNAASVRLAMAVGLDRVIETARALGIEAELSETPALALGASGVTLLDMVEGYAGIASGIIPVVGRGISGISSGEDGSYFSFRYPEPPLTGTTQALLSARDDITNMLALVVSDGTGQAAHLPGGAVGKTGTSQDYRDALFIGWNGSLVTGVWVGNDDNTPMDGVTGGALPARIWQTFMAATATSAPAQATSELAAPEPAAPSCNISACERSYRSFRASDCTYQPYRGQRKLCTR